MSIIKGSTVDEKFQSIEKIFADMTRRKADFKTPEPVARPCIIAGYADTTIEDTILYRQLFLTDMAVNLAIFIEALDRKSTALATITIAKDTEFSSVTVQLKEGMNKLKEILVRAEERLTITVSGPSEVKPRGIWLGGRCI